MNFNFFLQNRHKKLYDKNLKCIQLCTSLSLKFNMLRNKGACIRNKTILCHGNHTSILCIYH